MKSRRRDLEADIRGVVSSADRYTVLVGNEMTGTSHYVGSFDSEQDAVAYAEAEIGRTRRFATYELWTGTAKFPGRFVRVLGRGSSEREASTRGSW